MDGMNLVFFSIKTKGFSNFTRRLWTVFTRFGFSENRSRKALYSIVDLLQSHNSAPTFFIPAVVLRRHPALIAEIAGEGAEIGIHGYVHNDYRTLSPSQQYKQTEHAISVFQETRIKHKGFRNPYLGWTEDSLRVFSALGFGYESNEAVFHDVVDRNHFSPLVRSGFEKSLALFQAIPCSSYTLRPHFEDSLLRLPTSIPDDEMLFDRLRITDPAEIGQIWSKVMQRVYELGGLYALNLHPERGVLCQMALGILLGYAQNQSQPIWLARLDDIAQWWKEHSEFRLKITPLTGEHWLVEANCTPRGTVLARGVTVKSPSPTPGPDTRTVICDHLTIVESTKCPGLAVSRQTPQEVLDFLHEQGYPAVYTSQEEAERYALYLDIPEGLGTTRKEQRTLRTELIQRIEQLESPLMYFSAWPDKNKAALSISGDIDSVTVQDFFLRVLEVSQKK
jgi:peptidoglycan/xylan/chitin deacetylase (PgdA/CDA1 family)